MRMRVTDGFAGDMGPCRRCINTGATAASRADAETDAEADEAALELVVERGRAPRVAEEALAREAGG
jgi:hypothetical protein